MTSVTDDIAQWLRALNRQPDPPTKTGVPGWRRDERRGLGVHFRLRAAWRFSGLVQDDFLSLCVKQSNEKIVSKLKTAFQATPRSVTYETIQTVLEVVNMLRREAGQRTDIEMIEFMLKPFPGADAYRNFLAFLRGEEPTVSGLELMTADLRETWLTDKWDDIEDSLVNFVQTTDLFPVANLYQKDMELGLEALHARICRDASDPATRIGKVARGRPVCFLPAGRHPGTLERVNFPQMLAWLQAFYRGNSLFDVLPLEGDDAIAAGLREIRLKMSKTPIIIVIGNCTSVGKSIAALRGMIMDEPVHELLPHLLHPLTPGPAEYANPLTFFETKIIVLSDLELAGLESHIGLKKLVPARSRARLVALLESEEKREAEERERTRRDQDTAPDDGNDDAELDRDEADVPESMDDAADYPPALTELVRSSQKVRSETDVTALRALLSFQRIVKGEGGATISVVAADAAASFQIYRSFLASAQSLDLVALRFVAMATDGLRFSTLQAVLLMWLSCQKDPKATDSESLSNDLATFSDSGLSAAWFRRFVVRHGELLLQCREQQSSASTAKASARRSAPFDMLDFRTRELREIVLTDFYSSTALVDIGRMHRFLFEVALRRQTDAMMASPPSNGPTAQFLRRLFQALFHGLCSVALGGTERDEKLAGINKVLPADKYKAYIRLYSIFYRYLAEARRGELSQLHGREALKSSILLVAGNVDRIWSGPKKTNIFYDRNSAPRPMLPTFLDDANSHNASANLAVGLDMMTNLGQAFFTQGKKELAEGACQKAFDLLANMAKILPATSASEAELLESGPGAVESPMTDVAEPAASGEPSADEEAEQDRNGPSVDKDDNPPPPFAVTSSSPFDWEINRTASLYNLQIDGLIQSDNNVEARVQIRTQLEKFGLPDGWEKVLEGLATDMFAFTTRAELSKKMATRLGKLARKCALGASERQLCAWADLLSRFGENEVFVTEREDTDSTADQQPMVLQAYLAMRLADWFRRAAFQFSPLGKTHVASSHSVRVLIRAGLRLAVRDGETMFKCAEAPDFFEQEARRQTDVLTRYYYRFAPERPGICIVESMFARMLHGDLERAERCLVRAEEFMTVCVDRPRMRMGLLLERAAVLLHRARQLSKVQGEQERVRNLLRAAARDAHRMQLLAKDFPYASWRRMAERLENSLARHLEKLPDISDPLAIKDRHLL